MGRLTSGVAHDFHNVLTVILGYGEMLLDSLGEDDPMRASLVKEILKAADQGATLTAQLLAFSRKPAHDPRPLALGPVVDDMEKILRRLVGKRVEVIHRQGPEPAHVHADPAQMSQVLMNLVLNARDAMPQGGKLLIETGVAGPDHCQGRVYGEVQPGAYCMMAVTDTGCGMDAETQAHLFEPFFTTKEQGRGTGLGLSIVWDIVRQAGGFLQVASAVGDGTTVRVYLPQVQLGCETLSGKAQAC
jgi:signal transduction histidine kinase